MSVELLRTENTEQMQETEIRALVDTFTLSVGRYEKLEKYYEAKNPTIMAVEKKSKSSPNNHLINGYAKYITDVLTGYFVGQPISYTAVQGGENLLEKIQEVFDYNDEQTENMELAKDASIYGVGYEIMYMDADSKIRFTSVLPSEMFCVYDTTIENNIVAALRVYQSKLYDGKIKKYVQVWDKHTERKYDLTDGIKLIDEKPHYWGDVPVVVYENNRERIGDFEPVLSLIDAYDKAQSNTLNDMDEFTDAYLALRNLNGTEQEDIEAMRDQRIILLDEDGDANWLIKSVNDTWIENFKERIRSDIHKFSATPDLTDNNFAGNSSGVSLRYKLMGMEQLRSVKERMFRRGLQRRIELICNVLKITGTAEDYTQIQMTFNDTLPQNLLELSQIIGNLSPFLSKESLLSLLYFIENPADEIEKKEVEEDEAADRQMAKMMELQAQQEQAQPQPEEPQQAVVEDEQ